MPVALSKGRSALGEELRTLGKLIFLFDANELNTIYANGASVNYWTDSSGNGYTVAQTGTNRPTFVTNADGFGNSTVRFASASAQYMSTSDNDNFDAMLAYDGITTFAYLKSTYNASSQTVWSKYTSGGNAGPLLRLRNSGSTPIVNEYLSTNAADSVQKDVLGTADLNGINALISADFTPGGNINMYYNGSVDTVNIQANGTGVFAGNASAFYLGALNAAGIVQTFNGDIYVVGAYQGVMSTTDRRNLERALSARFRLAVNDGSTTSVKTPKPRNAVV